MGIQSFSTKLVKDAAPAISEILAHIINSCIETSDIPSEWKTARITPLYKEGKKDDPNNYRPISVLPFISKILEKVINKDLLRHTNDQDITIFKLPGRILKGEINILNAYIPH